MVLQTNATNETNVKSISISDIVVTDAIVTISKKDYCQTCKNPVCIIGLSCVMGRGAKK